MEGKARRSIVFAPKIRMGAHFQDDVVKCHILMIEAHFWFDTTLASAKYWYRLDVFDKCLSFLSFLKFLMFSKEQWYIVSWPHWTCNNNIFKYTKYYYFNCFFNGTWDVGVPKRLYSEAWFFFFNCNVIYWLYFLITFRNQ